MSRASDTSPVAANSSVAVFVHQPTGSVTLVEGSLDIEALLRDFAVPSKEGPSPASIASVKSLPRVRVSEPGLECPVCLSEHEAEAEAKEMPCGHIFHSGCIDEWLGISRSCPLCRFNLPAAAESGWRIHVFVSPGRPGPGPGSHVDTGPENDAGNDELPLASG